MPSSSRGSSSRSSSNYENGEETTTDSGSEYEDETGSKSDDDSSSSGGSDSDSESGSGSDSEDEDEDNSGSMGGSGIMGGSSGGLGAWVAETSDESSYNSDFHAGNASTTSEVVASMRDTPGGFFASQKTSAKTNDKAGGIEGPGGTIDEDDDEEDSEDDSDESEDDDDRKSRESYHEEPPEPPRLSGWGVENDDPFDARDDRNARRRNGGGGSCFDGITKQTLIYIGVGLIVCIIIVVIVVVAVLLAGGGDDDDSSNISPRENSPTFSPAPSVSTQPSSSPTISSAPTTSPRPTTSFQPSANPTVSLAPTITPQPTTASPTRPPPPGFVNDVALYDMVIANTTDGGTALRREGTPQQRAYLWLENDFYSNSLNDERKLQRYRLMSFFYGTNGENWKTRAFWGRPSTECGWEYNQPGEVGCDSSNRLTELTILNNNVTGTLVPELGEITSLKILNIENTADPNLGMTGSIPLLYRNLENLEVVRFMGNRFSALPDDMFTNWTKARVVNLSRNLIPGNIPSSVEALVNVENFNLGGNEFVGNLPTQIGAMQKARIFIVSRNNLTGNLPPQFATLTNLNIVRLNDNQFVGDFPNIAGMTKLSEMVDFSNNKFSGQIPNFIGNAPLIRTLRLRNIGVTGQLPERFRLLGNLKSLDLSNNPGLQGNVPSAVCRSLLNADPSVNFAIVDCINEPCQPTAEVCCDCCTCVSG